MSSLIDNLARESGLREVEVRRIIAGAPVRYKTYAIKRPSGRERIISQPTPEVKLLQRSMITILLSRLPVHPAATAYRPGLSLRANAEPHAGNGPILKMDFKNFFPSIRGEDWVKYCVESKCLDASQDIYHSAQLLFHKPRGERVLRLAIGAPSSPSLSNALLFRLDQAISDKMAEDHVVYTRYADDLTFSARRTGFMVRVIRDVSAIVRSMRFPKLDFNTDKQTYVTKKFGRRVTGLTLSNDGRVTIGRGSKRKLFAAVHHYIRGSMSREDTQMLAGMLAHVNSVEPDFLGVLKRKYGHTVINDIQHVFLPGEQLPAHDPPLARRDD